MNGYDDIDFLKNMKSEIQDFASKLHFSSLILIYGKQN